MVFSVNEIIAQINLAYPAKAHLYQVTITSKQAANSADPAVMFNCSSVVIPGINIETVQDKRYGIGLNYNVVENKTFSECTMTFYESELEPEREYFTTWIASIIDPVSKRANYYSEYVRDIQIFQYNNKGVLVYQANLIDCIPGNISGLERGYDKSEVVPSFEVNMLFQKIEEKFLT